MEGNVSDDVAKSLLTTHGPLVVDLYINSKFYLYKQGIMTRDVYCSDDNDDDLYWHGALVVGYGSENGTDYYIARMSFGTNWGEDGYFRIATGNTCGLTGYYVMSAELA